jgi:hypothetical protein
MKHTFFNNLEEAKRIESLLRGFDAGLYCIQENSQQFVRTATRLPDLPRNRCRNLPIPVPAARL